MKKPPPLSPEAQQKIGEICASCPQLKANRGGGLHCRWAHCTKKKVQKIIAEDRKRHGDT